MKRLLAIILSILFCMSFTSCKNEGENAQQSKASSECSEQEIRMLMEHNLDCYYLFYVAPLSEGGGTDSDGYTKADTSFFASYNELKDFVENTYTKEKSTYLLTAYPREGKPLYVERNGSIYVDLDAVSPVEYSVMWDENYTVEFTENSLTNCSFALTTTDFDGGEYVTEGSAVFENGKWLLEDIVY